LEQSVVHCQIHIHDHDVSHRRGDLPSAKDLSHSFGIGRLAFVEKEPQGVVHPAFSFLSRQMKNRQVVFDHAAGAMVREHVVGDPEPAGREHRITVAVLLERSGLADQPVDDVAVLDAMLASASESRQGVQLLGPVPDVECFGADVHIHLFTDQSAGQRIGVAADVNRAP